MNARTLPLLGLVVALPMAVGCASRTAPFDSLDDASMTILKLQGEQAAANPLSGAAGAFPIPIPGMTPEQQQQLQQQLGQIPQQLTQMIPGLPQIPGLPGTQPAAPQFNGYTILGQSYGDDDTKDEILDLFGDEDSFNQNRGQCFTPGMAIIFTPADGSPNIELMVSFACNQAVGNGFQWPYPANGLAPESGNTLRNVYQRAFGAPPPASGG